MSKAEKWENKYLQERDAHQELKRKCNEQQLTITRMYTKFRMIESNFNKKGGADGESNALTKAVGVTGAASRKDAKETDNLIKDLRQENSALRKQNLTTKEKLRSAGLAGKLGGKRGKKISVVARRRGRGGNASGNVSGRFGRGGDENAPPLDAGEGAEGGGGRLESLLKDFASAAPVDAHDRRTRELVGALRERLVSTERRLQRLHGENNALRDRVGKGGSGGRKGGRAEVMEVGGGLMDGDAMAAQRELKDRETQLTLLRSRYEHLEAKHRAGRDMQESTVEKMEEDNRTIREMRRQLMQLKHDKEMFETQKHQVLDLEEELDETRRANADLESRLTALCENPFINTAFQSKKETDDLYRLRKTEKHHKMQVRGGGEGTGIREQGTGKRGQGTGKREE